MNPKYPQVKVQLVGEDGNAFAILGRVTGAMRRAGLAETERNAFTKEATSGDYDNLLRTVLAWVSVDGLGDESDEDSDDDYECIGDSWACELGGCEVCDEDAE